jgi:hypothetical protein
MKRIASLFFLVATTATATADPIEQAAVRATTTGPSGYVHLGLTSGLEQLLYAGAHLDGGFRIGSTPLYVRGMVESGRAIAVLDAGNYQSYRLGLEARRCAITTCLFAGVDGGTRRAQLVHDFDSGMSVTDHYNVGLVIPRAGIEVGSRLRGRFALELPTAFDRTDSVTGLAVSAGVGYAF